MRIDRGAATPSPDNLPRTLDTAGRRRQRPDDAADRERVARGRAWLSAQAMLDRGELGPRCITDRTDQASDGDRPGRPAASRHADRRRGRWTRSRRGWAWSSRPRTERRARHVPRHAAAGRRRPWSRARSTRTTATHVDRARPRPPLRPRASTPPTRSADDAPRRGTQPMCGCPRHLAPQKTVSAASAGATCCAWGSRAPGSPRSARSARPARAAALGAPVGNKSGSSSIDLDGGGDTLNMVDPRRRSSPTTTGVRGIGDRGRDAALSLTGGPTRRRATASTPRSTASRALWAEGDVGVVQKRRIPDGEPLPLREPGHLLVRRPRLVRPARRSPRAAGSRATPTSTRRRRWARCRSAWGGRATSRAASSNPLLVGSLASFRFSCATAATATTTSTGCRRSRSILDASRPGRDSRARSATRWTRPTTLSDQVQAALTATRPPRGHRSIRTPNERRHAPAATSRSSIQGGFETRVFYTGSADSTRTAPRGDDRARRPTLLRARRRRRRVRAGHEGHGRVGRHRRRDHHRVRPAQLRERLARASTTGTGSPMLLVGGAVNGGRYGPDADRGGPRGRVPGLRGGLPRHLQGGPLRPPRRGPGAGLPGAQPTRRPSGSSHEPAMRARGYLGLLRADARERRLLQRRLGVAPSFAGYMHSERGLSRGRGADPRERAGFQQPGAGPSLALWLRRFPTDSSSTRRPAAIRGTPRAEAEWTTHVVAGGAQGSPGCRRRCASAVDHRRSPSAIETLQAGFAAEVVAEGGRSIPVKMALAPDGRLLFNELATGNVQVIDPISGLAGPAPFATLAVERAAITAACSASRLRAGLSRRAATST